MSNAFKRVIRALLALFFVGVSVALLFLQLQNLEMAIASTTWLPVQGIVSDTDYEYSSVGRKMSNTPYVTCHYRVEGKEYTSKVFSFGDNVISSDMLKDYPKGKVIIVYYNPIKPWEAVIIKSVGKSTISGLLYVQTILSLSVMVLIYVFYIEIRVMLSKMRSIKN